MAKEIAKITGVENFALLDLAKLTKVCILEGYNDHDREGTRLSFYDFYRGPDRLEALINHCVIAAIRKRDHEGIGPILLGLMRDNYAFLSDAVREMFELSCANNDEKLRADRDRLS